ncbi:MAG TPA: acyltransferase [Gemmatimonadales bacterium]|nr:acyltransferase [Gemmatimonadales bacterium]
MTTQGHAGYLARTYFPALDGLRALSIALVVLWHATEEQYYGWLHGFHGVTIFFVLSGFLITTLLLREEDRHGAVSFRGFYLRRVFRILPLYYLVLAVYCVLILLARLQPDRLEAFQRALPFYTFYLSEFPHYLRFRAPFDLSWSLGIEEKFYLVWPALAFGLLTVIRSRLRVAAGLLLLTVLLPSSWGATVFLRPYGLILLGCVVALVMHAPDGFNALRGLGRFQLPLLFGLLLSCVLVDEPKRWEIVVALMSALLLISTLVAPEGMIARFFSTAPLVKVGTISYGIYLIHQLCLNAVERVIPGTSLLGGTLLAIVGGAVSVGGALLLSRFVEQPLIRIGRRLAARPRADDPVRSHLLAEPPRPTA